jgi:hypothetical protein
MDGVSADPRRVRAVGSHGGHAGTRPRWYGARHFSSTAAVAQGAPWLPSAVEEKCLAPYRRGAVATWHRTGAGGALPNPDSDYRLPAVRRESIRLERLATAHARICAHDRPRFSRRPGPHRGQSCAGRGRDPRGKRCPRRRARDRARSRARAFHELPRAQALPADRLRQARRGRDRRQLSRHAPRALPGPRRPRRGRGCGQGRARTTARARRTA